MTSRLRFVCIALLLLGSALAPAGVHAQCIPGSRIAASSAPALASFATPTFVNFDNGFIVYQTTVSVVVTPEQGKAWDLCVRSNSANLGSSQGYTKPVGDLEWQYAGGAWTPLSTAPQQIVGNQKFAQTVSINIRMRLSWTADPPGTFGTDLIFIANN